jgi:16S rRNA (guanine527-N7)-methyltransferase
MDRTETQLATLGASSQAIEKLTHYADMIRQWNKAINLVAPSTVKDLWERHFLDSAQLFPHVKGGSLIDLGSGGGLPGLVLAMMAPDQDVTLIESDQRKCVFLREVSRETKLSNVTVVNQRIEQAVVNKADFVTARALAPLSQLIDWGLPLLKPGGKMAFLKGQDASNEVATLATEWHKKVTLVDSLTDPKARIVLIDFST